MPSKDRSKPKPSKDRSKPKPAKGRSKPKPAKDRSKLEKKEGLPCQFCKGATKLIFVHPPERYGGLIIENFECVACGDITTVVTKPS